MIDTSVWLDRRVRALGPWARCVLAFGMTSHVRLTVPGLIVIGRAGLAEGMGAPPREISKALDEMISTGILEIDEGAPLICLTPAAEWDVPPTAKALIAWKRQLEALPASPLVARHVARLRVTFASQCPADLLEDALGSSRTDNGNDVAPLDSLSIGSPLPIPKGKGKEKEKEKEKGTEKGNAAAAARVFTHWHSKLWKKISEREPKPTEARMKPIRARLADGYTEAELSHVIDVVACSKFHLGANDTGKPHIEPELIFRATKIDGWLATKTPLAKVQGGEVDFSSAAAKGEELFGGGE